MHIILTGATGLIGSAVLQRLLQNPSVTHISILSRSRVPQATDTPGADQKCTVHRHSDFSKPPPLEMLSQLKDAHGCIWAQGISQNAVDAKTYEQITYDYPTRFAQAFMDAGICDRGVFNFVYVSGEGATTRPGRFAPIFARVKGRAEAALFEMSKQKNIEGGGSFNVYSARPALVDGSDHPEIASYLDRRQESFMKRLEKPLLTMARPLVPGMMSPTRSLGDALGMLATDDGRPLPDGTGVESEGRTIRNIALRRMVGI